MEKCPGLLDTLNLRLRSRSKRAADTILVSPLKKVSRTIDRLSANEGTHSSKPTTTVETIQSAVDVGIDAPQALTVVTQIRSGPDLPPSTTPSATSTTATPTEVSHDSLAELSISAWEAGYGQIKKMLDDDSKMTEALAFPTVFGLRYVKSTACKYKRLWKNAPEKMKATYIKLGNSKAASWHNFSIALRNGRNGRDQSSPPPSPSASSPPQNIQIPASFPDLPSPPSLQPSFDDPTDSVSIQINVKTESIEPDIAIEDFSKLCPFCDRQLPDSPSELLVKLRAELETNTWPDPMPDNPLHRSAPSFQAYIHYCTRHEFETTQLPIGILAGWPMTPDFGGIFDRICREYPLLAGAAKDENNEFMISAKEYYKLGPTRLQGVLGQLTRSSKIGAG